MFNVITPLARYGNVPELINNLKHQKITWIVITDDDNDTPFEVSESFIEHYICPNKDVDFWARCNYSINWFIENQHIHDDEYYCILNDDDSYDDTFFESLRREVEKTNTKIYPNDLIITSMKRGHFIPDGLHPSRRHPPYTLYAVPEKMHPCGVGVEQFFIKGKHLKNHRLPLTVHGDGELITELVRNYKTLYLPDLYVLFNYLEPGRWIKYSGDISTLTSLAQAQQDLFALLLNFQL